MDNTKLKEIILKVLKSDHRLWNQDKTKLNQNLLLDLVDDGVKKITLDYLWDVK